MDVPDKVNEYIKKGAILVEFYFDFNIIMPDFNKRKEIWRKFGNVDEEVISLSEGFAHKHIYEIAKKYPSNEWIEKVKEKRESIRKELEESLVNVAAGFVDEFIKNMVAKQKIWFGVGNIEPPVWDKESVSNYASITLVFRSFSDLAEAVVSYNPVGIEILKPDRLDLEVSEVQEALNRISNLVYQTKLNMLTEEKKKEFLKAYKHREEIGKRVRDRVFNRDK